MMSDSDEDEFNREEEKSHKRGQSEEDIINEHATTPSKKV